MLNDIRALTFDVFGTVVNWRGTIIREGASYSQQVDWNQLATAWRSKYSPTLRRVANGELPWMSLDLLERQMLEETLRELGISAVSEAELARLSDVWTRLDPWPDSPPGLARLKRKYTICTLSNGSVRQLAGMAKHGNLPWDVIFSVEMFRAFKPDPKVYLGAAKLLQLEPRQLMMVAAHPHDLRAAKALGLGTAYVPRPDEWGSAQPLEPSEPGEFDVTAAGFEDLASKLGC